MGAFMSMIGAGTKAYGSILSGRQTQAAYDFNAKLMEQNKNEAMISAKLNADKQQAQFVKIQGAAKASYGASGVESTSGSVIDILAANAANAEMDKQNILYGGMIKATNFANQASMNKRSGKNAMQAAYWNAAGAGMEGAKDLYSNGYFDGGGVGADSSGTTGEG